MPIIHLSRTKLNRDEKPNTPNNVVVGIVQVKMRPYPRNKSGKRMPKLKKAAQIKFLCIIFRDSNVENTQ